MFKRFLIAVFLSILAVFLLGLAVLTSNFEVPILMYHHVNPEARDCLTVSPDTFERQMRFLKERHYLVLSVEALAGLIKQGKPIPPKTVVITFDDGNKDNYTYAFPILKKYGLCANLFLIIDEISRPQGDKLTWEEVLAMRDSGLIYFGSHALGPEPLVNIKSAEEAKRQIFESKKALEARLNRRVDVFSYPEGRFTPQIRQWVKEAGYEVAVTTNPGKKFPNKDLYALKRLRISSNSGNLFIFWVETSGYYNFMREHRKK